MMDRWLNKILCGDCLDILKTMPDGLVSCIVTSPPYWGLRDYGVEGQLGLEKTPEEYTAKMVEIFREARRVLRNDGVMFLNLGDSYASRRVPVYDISDTIPQDCPLHDSIWNHPCDGCQAVSVLRSFDKDHVAFPKLSGDSLYPSQEHREFENGHFPKSHSFHPRQTPQSSCAIQGRDAFQDHVDEQPLSFRGSMLDEFSPQSRGGCLQMDNSSFCQDEVDVKNPDVFEFGHKRVCTSDISPKFSFSGGRRNNNHNVYPCRYLTTKDRISQCLKPKDLVGIPWRVAFALQADGWYLRQDIIWHKPNPMPESVTDRCTKAHEYIFMMSKSARYYYDAEAIVEPAVDSSIKRFTDNGKDKQRGHVRRHAGFNGRYAERLQENGVPETRNRRSVWTIATYPCSEAHFATFPPDLIKPCILAGCPENGIVLDPFFGAGTTGVVCTDLGRNYIGIELNPEYVAMAEERIRRATAQTRMFV